MFVKYTAYMVIYMQQAGYMVITKPDNKTLVEKVKSITTYPDSLGLFVTVHTMWQYEI